MREDDRCLSILPSPSCPPINHDSDLPRSRAVRYSVLLDCRYGGRYCRRARPAECVWTTFNAPSFPRTGYTEFSGTWGHLGSSQLLVPPQRSKRIYEVKFQSDDTPTSTVPPWNLGTTNRTSRHWRSVHRCERVALYGGLDGGE